MAVLVDITQYEASFIDHRLYELNDDEVTPEQKAKADKAKLIYAEGGD